MTEYLFAAQQGRKIPKEDKNFSVNNRAKAMIAEKGKDAVVNSTLGVLLDEEGGLVVLSSVNEVFQSLEAVDFAADRIRCQSWGPETVLGYVSLEQALKQAEADFMPGAVLNSCRAGRVLPAVLWL